MRPLVHRRRAANDRLADGVPDMQAETLALGHQRRARDILPPPGGVNLPFNTRCGSFYSVLFRPQVAIISTPRSAVCKMVCSGSSFNDFGRIFKRDFHKPIINSSRDAHLSLRHATDGEVRNVSQ